MLHVLTERLTYFQSHAHTVKTEQYRDQFVVIFAGLFLLIPVLVLNIVMVLEVYTCFTVFILKSMPERVLAVDFMGFLFKSTGILLR